MALINLIPRENIKSKVFDTHTEAITFTAGQKYLIEDWFDAEGTIYAIITDNQHFRHYLSQLYIDRHFIQFIEPN